PAAGTARSGAGGVSDHPHAGRGSPRPRPGPARRVRRPGDRGGDDGHRRRRPDQGAAAPRPRGAPRPPEAVLRVLGQHQPVAPAGRGRRRGRPRLVGHGQPRPGRRAAPGPPGVAARGAVHRRLYELTASPEWGDEPGDWADPVARTAPPVMWPSQGWSWHGPSDRVITGRLWG